MSGSGYDEVLALKVLYVSDCVERKRRAKLPTSASAPCVVAAARSFQASLCACMFIFCMCVFIYVYLCGHVYMYVYARVYVYIYVCIYTHVYVYVYAYVCIDCGSQYQCFSVWTVSCMRTCITHQESCTYV